MDQRVNMADSAQGTSVPTRHECHLAVPQAEKGKTVHAASTRVDQPPLRDLPAGYGERLQDVRQFALHL